MDSRPVSRAASEGGPPRVRPPPPPPTYLWEEIRRSRSRGGYPWTILDKEPLEDETDVDALISGSFLPLRMTSSLPDDYPLHTHNHGRHTASEPAQSIRSAASTEPELYSIRRSSASTFNSAMEHGAVGGRSPTSFQFDEDVLMDDGYGDELPDFVIEYFQTHSNALEEDLPDHIVEFIQSKAAALERRRKLEQLSDVPEQEESYTPNEMRILRDAQRRLEQEEQLDKKIIPDEEEIPMADDEHVIEADRLGLRRGPRQEVRDSDQEEAEEEPEEDFDHFFQRQESPEPQLQPAKLPKHKKSKAVEPSTEVQKEQELPKKKKFNLRSISMPPKPNIRMPNMTRPQLPKLKMPTFNLPAGLGKKEEQKDQQDEAAQTHKSAKGKGTAKKGKKAEAQKVHEERKKKRTQSASPMRQKINDTLSSWQNSLRASFGKGKPTQPTEDSVNEFVEFTATPQKGSDEDHQYEEIQAPPPSMAAVTVVEGAQGMPSVTLTEAPPRNRERDEEEEEEEEVVEGIVEEPIEDDAVEEDGQFAQSPILEEETMEGVENLPEAEEVTTDQDANEDELDEEPLGVQPLPDLRVDATECQEVEALPEANAEDIEKPTTAQTLAAKLGAKSKSALQATTTKSKQALQATKTKLDELSRDSLRKTKNTFNKENIQSTGKKLQSKFNDTLQRTKKKGKAPPKTDDFAATLPRKCSPSIFDSSTSPRKSRAYETSTPKIVPPRRNRTKHPAAPGNYPSLPIRKRRMNRHGDTAFNNVANTLHGSPRMQPSQSLPTNMNAENDPHNVVLRPRRRGKGPSFPSPHHGADHRRHGVYNNTWQSAYTQGPHRPQSAFFYSDMKNNALDEMAELDYRSMSQELHHIFYAPVNALAAVSGSPIKKPERPSRSRDKKPSTDHRLSLQAEREIPEYYNVPPRRPHRGPSTSSLQPSSVSLNGSRSQCSYDGDVDDRSSTTTLLSTLLGQNEPVIPKRTRNKTTQPVLDSYQTWPRTKSQAEPVPVAPQRNRSKVSVSNIDYPVPEEIEEVSDYVNTEDMTELPATPILENEPEIVPAAPRRKKLASLEEVPSPIFEGMTWPRTKRTPPPTAPKREKKQRQSQVSLSTPVPFDEIQDEPKEINTAEEETEEILVKQTPAEIQAEEQEAIQMIDDAIDQVLAPSPGAEPSPDVEDPYATIEPRNKERPPRPPPPVLPPVPADETYNASTTGVPYDYIYAVPRRLQRPSDPSTAFHTVPRPARPPRAYWTIRPQRPPRRKTTVDFLDLEGDIHSRSTDPSDISDRTMFTGSARDLQSPPVVERMRFRPLPAPPRAKRTKSKETTDRSNYSNESDSARSAPTPPKPPRRTGSMKKSPKPVHKQLSPNIPATCEDEELPAQPVITTVPAEEIHTQPIVTVAAETYLGNVPPSKVEESTETDGYEPIEMSDPTPASPKVEEVSIATQTDPHPEFDDDLLAASQDYGEDLHSDLLPEEVTPPTQKVDQESQSGKAAAHQESSRIPEIPSQPEQENQERPKSRAPSISKPPPSFHQLRTPPPERRDHEHNDDDTPSCPPFPMSFSFPPINVNLPDRLHLTELDVDRLNVRELQANRLVVSAIDTLTLQVSELTSATGPLVVSLPAAVASEQRRPLLAVTEATQTSFDIAPVAEAPTTVRQAPVAETTEESTRPFSSTSQGTDGSTPLLSIPQKNEVSPPLSGTSELKEDSTSPSSTSEPEENDSIAQSEEEAPKMKEKLATDEAEVRVASSSITSQPLVQSKSPSPPLKAESTVTRLNVELSSEEPDIEALGAVRPAPVTAQVSASIASEPTIPELSAQLAVLSARELSRLAGIGIEQAREVAGRFARHVWQGLTDLLARRGIHLSSKEEEGLQVLLVLLLVVVVCIFLLVGSRVPGQRWEIYYPY